MPLDVSEVKQIEFNEQVHQVYQAQGHKLKDAFRIRRNVTGDREQFRIMSDGIAKEHIPGSVVDPMGLQVTKATATLKPWIAVEFSDIFLQETVNFDQQQELAEAVAMAIGRRFDQIGINALDASSTTKTIANGGTGMTVAKVREASKLLNDDGVPNENRFFLISPEAEADLMADDQFTSSDFIDRRTVVSGTLDGVSNYGFKFIRIPNMTGLDGLPKTGDIRTCFAFHMKSAGIAISKDVQTRIGWREDLQEHQVNGMFQGGGVAIDNKGIVKVDIDESV